MSDAYGSDVAGWNERREEHRSIGQTIRATAKPGDKLVLDHFGSIRRVTVVEVSKSRVRFEWTGKTTGTTRKVWVNDEQLGYKARDCREVR